MVSKPKRVVPCNRLKIPTNQSWMSKVATLTQLRTVHQSASNTSPVLRDSFPSATICPHHHHYRQQSPSCSNSSPLSRPHRNQLTTKLSKRPSQLKRHSPNTYTTCLWAIDHVSIRRITRLYLSFIYVNLYNYCHYLFSLSFKFIFFKLLFVICYLPFFMLRNMPWKIYFVHIIAFDSNYVLLIRYWFL